MSARALDGRVAVITGGSRGSAWASPRPVVRRAPMW